MMKHCAAGDVREKPISSIDFSDASSLQGIKQELTPEERTAFNEYAMSRVIVFDPEGVIKMTRSDGSQPQTVGEAISVAQAHMAIREQRYKSMEELLALGKQLTATGDEKRRVKNQAERDRLEK